MAAVSYTIPQVIGYAQVSEVMMSNDIFIANFAGNQFLDKRHPRLLYMARKALQWYNVYGTNQQVLNQMANYVVELMGDYLKRAINYISGLTQTKPVVTGPSNQSVSVGGNATFTIGVTSSLPYSIQWYDHLGNPIPGATSLSLVFSNAQLTDSGDTFFARVTSAAGVSVSATATLTVTASLVASYYFGSTDYSTNLNAGIDNVAYVGTFPITAGQPLSFTWPSGAANQFIVVRYPATESTKTQYANAPLNNGLIPSLAFDNVKTIGAFKYIFSRSGNTFGQNTANPLIFS
jgi:hypothetical protein